MMNQHRSVLGRRMLGGVTATATLVAGLLTAAPSDGAQGPTRVTASAKAPDRSCPQLKLAADWFGNNAAKIQRVIDRRGTCQRPHPKHQPYAVFDWDNTVIKNDIADQTLFWTLRHNRLRQPSHRDWGTTSRWMTDAGAAALNDLCGPLAKPGHRVPTRSATACTDEILSFRKEGTTSDGAAAFEGYNERQMEASYAWMAQLLQGQRPAEVRATARQARRAALDAPIGATQRVGSSDETAWIRYYPQMRDLIRTLRKAGIEPWVISASPQEWADVWGKGVGIDRAHTVGIRTLKKHGRIVPHLQGCGGVPDGADRIMTYINGKRCWINKVINRDHSRSALALAPWHKRQVLAGGDATTDVRMLRDATGVHVVINRNKAELMCHAFYNRDRRWVVNPMFIEPLPKYEPGYPCSTTAFTRADGSAGPVRDGGRIVPDQEDRVHG